MHLAFNPLFAVRLKRHLLGWCVLLLFASACNRTLLRTKTYKYHDNKDLSLRTEVLYAKANLRYKDANNALETLLHLRLRYDSLLWLSVSLPIGLEAFRIAADHKQLSILNRFQKSYHVYDYKKLAEQWHIPTMSYNWLERILLARPLLNAQDYEQLTTQQDSTYVGDNNRGDSGHLHLYARKGSLRIDTKLSLATGHILRQELRDDSNRRLVAIYRYGHHINNMDNHPPISHLPYPSELQLHLELPASSPHQPLEIKSLQITFQNWRILKKKEARFPFKVPPRYEKPATY